MANRASRFRPAALFVVLCLATTAGAFPLTLTASLEIQAGEKALVGHREGTTLPSPTYEWWYGCSPTAAGMLIGYYDREGYNAYSYPNLVPGGVAEPETFVGPPTAWSALVNNAIASLGHVSDFYGGDMSGGGVNFGNSGDDASPPHHGFDSLADFMGTSQDSAGNPNGWTTFWYWNDGSPFTASDAVTQGVTNNSGMYGIGEYLQYAGYTYTTLYNQYIDILGLSYGFTFDQYRGEVDAGRPVIVHVEDHSMLGYGYVDGTTTMLVYDTWAPNGQNPGTLAWGGGYPYGSTTLEHYGVTVLALAPSSTMIPEPTSLALLAFGLAAAALRRRRAA